MVFDAKVVRVLIASPTDTKAERDAVEDLIQRWNSSRAEHDHVVLLPLRWETRPAELTETVSSVIGQLVADADIVIAIFRNQMGAVSGTTREIERALTEGKRVYVFFSDQDIRRHDLDPGHLWMLAKYQEQLSYDGMFSSYTSLIDLQTKVREAIERELPLLDSQPASRFFLSRSEATPWMREEMRSSSSLVFLGISNSSLSKYLSGVIAETHGSRLPWQEIEVYFADRATGEAWEGAAFEANCTEAILNIWKTLRAGCQSGKVDPHCTIRFRRAATATYFNGSLFRSPNDCVADFEYPVMYVVFSIPFDKADTKDSSTLRLTSRTNDYFADKYHGRYTDAFREISESSILILERTLDVVWDASAQAWYNFEKRFHVYLDSMRRLTEFVRAPSHQHILDIGCGTGQVSRILAERVPSGSLTMLDSSPDMIRIARSEVGPARVTCVVADVRRGLENLLVPPGGFDLVVVHFALQCIVDHTYSLNDLAVSLAEVLNESGEVVIAVHNMVLTDDEFQQTGWVDPLRSALKSGAERHGYTLRRPSGDGLSSQAIEAAFNHAGLATAERHTESFPRVMADRVLMWRVPAVLDSLVEVSSMTPRQITSLLDEVEAEVAGQPTLDTKVLYLRFRRTSPATADRADRT